MQRFNQRRRGDGIALLLLFHELYRNYQYLPIVTLSTIVGQILIYLKVLPFIPWLRDRSVCVSLSKILERGEYSKILISQIEHADDWHLYYNMISFMSKSKSLEEKFGTVKYVLLLLLFTLSTGLAYLGLNYLLLEWTHDDSYYYRCAVGFSGVIFALKVLTTHYWPNDQSRTFHVMGMPIFSTGSINSKYLVWIELAFISLISPNASFVGHLAGILVGLAFTYGPLEWVLDFVYGIFSHLSGFQHSGAGRARFTQTSQPSGYRATPTFERQFSAQSPNSRNPTHHVNNELNEEEQIRRATEQSLRDYEENENRRRESQERHYGFESLNRQVGSQEPAPSAPPSPEEQSHEEGPRILTAEELRQQRLRRFT